VLALDDFRRLVRRTLDIMSTEVWPERYCSGLDRR
jgi:lambda repressor-like predicted transcriptional regulator